MPRIRSNADIDFNYIGHKIRHNQREKSSHITALRFAVVEHQINHDPIGNIESKFWHPYGPNLNWVN
ncbi:hypothetical protein CE91St28_21320 [Pyramidobacter piscolens]|nr:hypothetical protein CE91St28_21320 [Pyramidobacter piscolens]